MKCESIWQHYQVTESGKSSVLSPIERLKLAYQTIQNCINLNYLQSNKYIVHYYILNDPYQLQGESKSQLLQPVMALDRVVRGQKWKMLKGARALLFAQPKLDPALNLNAIAEQKEASQSELGSHDNSSSKNNSELQLMEPAGRPKMQLKAIHQKLNEHVFCRSHLNAIVLSNQKRKRGAGPGARLPQQTSDQKFLKNLNYLWSFKPSCPWYIPALSIKEYYGEKVAFYFAFLSFYTKNLLFIGLLGGAVLVTQQSMNSASMGYVFISIFFSFFTTCWASFLYVSWYQQENLLASQFGLGLQKGQLTESSNQQIEERPDFTGTFQRNLVDNNLNSVYYSRYKKHIKYIISFAVCFGVFLCYMGIVLSLLVLSQFLDYKTHFPKGLSWLKIQATLPA